MSIDINKFSHRMLELADINEFAQSAYAPFIVAVATVLVSSCFLDLRKLMNRVIDWSVGLFSGFNGESADGGHPQYLRLIIVALLFFAWLPMFRELSNLAPFVMIYDPLDAMYHNRQEWYAVLGCVYLDENSNHREIGQFIWNNVEILTEERAQYYRQLIGSRMAPWFFAQSMFTVLVIGAIVAFTYPELRLFRWRIFAFSIAAIAYLLFAGHSSLKNGITERAFALIEAHYSAAPSEAKDDSPCTKTLASKLEPSAGDTPESIRIELRWPEISRLVPF